ncbi:hypothetical protein BZ23_2627 [Yersinia pseudotuberculosis]|uniref:prepilin peptidase-dependent protein n=1 Tax=Yersinia pseudotuberculosis TaxID=633 RepID=UPI0005AD3BA1|nr:prepilin peptidase-dependent protein [Yersinia pseudotuberculosis]AJJ72437.1 hypothetical protein BZ23_2627 [Yersinia pseudotuberculosis]
MPLVVNVLSTLLNAQPTRTAGFTLPEMMLALSFGSLIALSTAQVLPKLSQQISVLQQHYRLELVMNQAMGAMEKDLRRAGFCHGKCQGEAITIEHYLGETAHSCLIVAYDLNCNGRWEGAKHQESEYFGYRLRNKALESQRGELNCHGRGWEKLFDPRDVTVTHFSVTPLSGQLFKLRLVGHKTGNPAIHHQVTYLIRGNNV